MATLANLARMTTATTGTGTITLGSAVSGFLTFANAGITNGQTVTYAIKDAANSEIGRGVYTSAGTTLTRSVLKSTNSNTAINLSGSAEVFITAAAEDFATIYLADGSASLPALTFDADTNTGIYRPGADLMALVTGGVEAARINASQQFGIGITPDAKLTVSNNTSSTVAPLSDTVLHLVQAAGSGCRLMLDAFSASNPQGAFSSRSARGTASSPTAVQSGDALFNLSCFGYGTTGYSTGGRAQITMTAAENWTDTAQGTNINLVTTSNGTAAGAFRLRVDEAGNVIIFTGQLFADDSTSTSAPVYSFDTDNNTGIARPAADTLAFVTGGTERARFDSSGWFGNGLTSPLLTEKLATLGPVSVLMQSADTFSGGLNIIKRGTTGNSSAAISSGTEIGYHSFYAYDGTSYGRGAFVFATSTEAWTSTAHGTKLAYYVTGNGTTSNQLAFQIDQDKSASFTASTTILSATAIPAGGTAGSGYKFSSTANFGVFFGSGAPTLSAAKGSLYLRSDGSSTSTRAYINTDGSTTWTAVTTAA